MTLKLSGRMVEDGRSASDANAQNSPSQHRVAIILVPRPSSCALTSSGIFNFNAIGTTHAFGLGRIYAFLRSTT